VAKDSGGIKPGDIVCKIDGLEAASAMARREPELSAATVAYHKRFAAGSLALGARDSQIELEVQTGAAAPRTVKVRRTLDFARFRDVRPQPWPALTELRQGIWYVDVDRSTLKEYAAALPKLAEAKGIVFDLRGYPRLGLNAPMPERLIGERAWEPVEHSSKLLWAVQECILSTGSSYGALSTATQTTRKPMLRLWTSGSPLLRRAARQWWPERLHEPPRNTRYRPDLSEHHSQTLPCMSNSPSAFGSPVLPTVFARLSSSPFVPLP
jgi:hypothetical protein